MGELHCLKVGCADTSIITGPNNTFLVDCCNIADHAHLLPKNKRLRGVFITHQHADHYSGLNFLKDEGFAIDFLVFCPYERRYNDQSVTLDEWNEFTALKEFFQKKGTEFRTPFRQSTFDKPWWAPDGLQFWLIGPEQTIASSDTREIHDASLIIKADLGTRHCCFAGDASDTLLEYVANNTTHYCDDILHASHHGSLNGAHLEFIKKAKAAFTVISTESGVYENVPHPTALQRYRENTASTVYRTDQGTIKWAF